jgi:hypothetical protein
MTEDTLNDGRHDFDFYMGSWRIQNRRLKERLKGCTEWEEFEGRSDCHPILGGVGNFDEVSFTRETGVSQGMTLRLFNPKSKQWHIYWADSNNVNLELPMVGGFQGERGEFYAHEPFEGRMVYSRFIWKKGVDTCHWEQAFSEDGGKTWETNWTMDSTRIK